MPFEIKELSEEEYAKRSAETKKHEEETRKHNRKVARESSWLNDVFSENTDITKRDRVAILRQCYEDVKLQRLERSRKLQLPA